MFIQIVQLTLLIAIVAIFKTLNTVWFVKNCVVNVQQVKNSYLENWFKKKLQGK